MCEARLRALEGPKRDPQGSETERRELLEGPSSLMGVIDLFSRHINNPINERQQKKLRL